MFELSKEKYKRHSKYLKKCKNTKLNLILFDIKH